MANNINIVITAQDKASEPLKRTSKNTDLFGKAVTAASRVALTAGAAGFAAITTGATMASKAAWDQVSAVEQATVALGAYEKDGNKVNAVLESLVAYARSDMGVLFNRKDLFAAAQGLKIMGDNTDSLTDHVKIMSRSVGLGLSTFEGLGNVIQRVGSTGVLYADDLKYLQNAGYALDKSMSGSKQTFESLFAALDKGIPVDAMNGQASTIEGQGIRMETAWRGIGNAILGVDADTNKFIKGGLGDRIRAEKDKMIHALKVMAPAISAAMTAVLDFTDGAMLKAANATKWLREQLGKIPEAIKAVVSWVEDRWTEAVEAAGDALRWFGDRVKDGQKKLEELKGWIEENETAIRSVATVLGVIWGPALVRAGALAVVQGAKIAIAGLAAGGGWVAGAASAALAWVVNTAKAVLASAVSSAKMVLHAVKVSVAHSINAVKATVAWTIQFAKMLLVSGVSSVKMAVHAADVGWAWVFNSARAATSWVVTELPKIVVATSATAIASARHAVVAGSAWVVNAARAAFAWVVTELPRIVAGFLVTSSSATSHALIASAAWIGSATKSAVAWVVTEIPRIVAAFAVASSAAVVQAAVAAGAWVASSVEASAAVGGLKALVAAPMVMPAIVVAAAIAALIEVKKAADEARSAVEHAAKVKDAAHKEDMRMIEVVKGQYQRGEISKAQYTKMLGIIGKNASGTNYWGGGQSLVGEHGPEVVSLPRGASVTPAYRSRETNQTQGGGGHTVIIENYNSYNQRDDQRFFRDLGFALELA